MENIITPSLAYTIEVTKKIIQAQIIANLVVLSGFLLAILLACSTDTPSPLYICCMACWSKFVICRNTKAADGADFINIDVVETVTNNLIT